MSTFRSAKPSSLSSLPASLEIPRNPERVIPFKWTDCLAMAAQGLCSSTRPRPVSGLSLVLLRDSYGSQPELGEGRVPPYGWYCRSVGVNPVGGGPNPRL